ncbi:Crp/Fnr family transcriptional regulator [Lentisalinibacter salinarum]|uniref:Crp/Fnr family transcriptional regulator n=2 Tax=Lentisalinibacter salinarum TaxID=2992239 RepID=UPI00386318F0
MSGMTQAVDTSDMIPENHLLRNRGDGDPTAGPNGGPVSVSSERHFGPETMLLREGSRASSVYVIRDGLVKLVRHLPNGRARIVGLRGPGSVLGMPVAEEDGAVSPHSAVTLGHVNVRCWPASHLRRLRAERPHRYIDLLESLHGHIRQADVWITEFSTGRIRSRVARLILYLERMEDGLPEGEVELLTCQDMGEALGVTPESVSRIVAELKRDGVLQPVSADRGEHLGCDRQKLRRLARD